MAQLKLLAQMKVSCDVSGEEVKHVPNRMQHEGDEEERMALGCQPPTQAECVERSWTTDKCEIRCDDEGDDDEQQQMVFEEIGALMCGGDGEEKCAKLEAELVVGSPSEKLVLSKSKTNLTSRQRKRIKESDARKR